MKTKSEKAFSPISLEIENQFEYDSLMLALRIGADGMRKSSTQSAPIMAPNCVEQMREALAMANGDKPNNLRGDWGGQPHHGHVRETER